jgi:hypothetical protein
MVCKELRWDLDEETFLKQLLGKPTNISITMVVKMGVVTVWDHVI